VSFFFTYVQQYGYKHVLYYGMFSVALALVAASAEEPDQMPKEKLVF
jgi:hypothetical protein